MVSGSRKSRTLAQKQRRTLGGGTSFRYVKRNRSIPKCAVTKKALRGIPRLTPAKFKNLNKSQKNVSRPYGGYMSHKALKDKIMKDMVLEEN